ncbi:hypothetical protein MTO96_000899 [Rhipicephalus appendiculatus]
MALTSSSINLEETKPGAKSEVIRSAYEVTTSDVFVIRGNTAALRCEVPASVRDFIHVVYWETDDGLTLHSGTLEGHLAS